LENNKQHENFNKTRKITIIAIIAALYAVLVIVFSIISYNILQIRIADALMPTSFFFGIPGSLALYLGCLIGNSFYASSLSVPIFDIIFGPIANFLSAIIGFYLYKKVEKFNWSGYKRIISIELIILLQNIINSVIVGLYLPIALFGFWDPYFVLISILGIFTGSLISMNLLGYFVYESLRKIDIKKYW